MPYPKSPHLFDVVKDKPLVWLHGEVKTPPWSLAARREAGYLLRRLQLGDRLSLPASRPIPCIGPAVHELRIKDQSAEWRIVCRTARVPTVCAHSMRGLFATLGMQAGAVPHVVAATLGHESPRVTLNSYALPGAADIAPARRTI